MGGSPRLRWQLDRLKLSRIDTIARPTPGLADWLKALRVHQWSKNVIVLVPLLLSQLFRDPAMLARGFWGLMLFNLVASSTYLLNDLSDLAADRVHRSKRWRPLAAGTIPIGSAVPVAAGLLLGGSRQPSRSTPALGQSHSCMRLSHCCIRFVSKRCR